MAQQMILESRNPKGATDWSRDWQVWGRYQAGSRDLAHNGRKDEAWLVELYGADNVRWKEAA